MNRTGKDIQVITNQPGSIDIGIRDNRNDQAYSGVLIVNSTVIQAPTGNNLRKLADTELVIIKPKKELLEVMFGCEVENKYDIVNEENEVIYVAEETSDCCMRFWFGSQRPLTVNIKDLEGNPVIFLDRPLCLQKGSWCLQTMSISAPLEDGIGEIKQLGRCSPELHVKDEQGSTQFIIQCPWLPSPCCGDVTFPILASDGVTPVGRISKNWSGIIGETFVVPGMFGIQFPTGIDTSSKVLLVGATFLLNYMFFEEKGHGPPLTIHT